MKGAPMRVVNERWNELENELGLGLPLNTLSEVDIANKWRLRALNAEKLLKQPQLTIPKSIADMLYEELNPLKRESMIEIFVLGVNYLVLSDELMKFVITGDNYHIICAYIAGKALGVDLVKVVEG